MRPVIRNFALVVVTMGVLCGCSSTAIIPAKVTYTYPLSDVYANYPASGRGAVAYLDNGSLELYLPANQTNQLRATRLVLQNANGNPTLWIGRNDTNLTARLIVKPESVTAENGDILANLAEGQLLVTFPKDDRYGGIQGQKLWLTSTAGPDETFIVRGLYWKSKASPGDLAR